MLVVRVIEILLYYSAKQEGIDEDKEVGEQLSMF